MNFERWLEILERDNGLRALTVQVGEACAVLPEEPEGKALQEVLDREAAALEKWCRTDEPVFALQQIRNQALACGFPGLAAAATRRLMAMGLPWFAEQVEPGSACPGLRRTLLGGPGGDVSPIGPDGRSTLNRSATQIEIREIGTGTLIASYPAGQGEIHVGPENRLMIASGGKAPFQIRDLASGKTFFKSPGKAPQMLRLSRDGRFVGFGWGESTGFDGEYFSSFEVEVWEVSSRKLRWGKKGSMDSSGGLTALALTQDGRFVAAIGCRTLFLASLPDGRDLGEWPTTAILSSDLAFTATGTALLVNNRSSIRVHDLGGNRFHDLAVPKDTYLDTMVVSPDGLRVLGGGSDWLGMWDIPTGKLLWERPLASGFQKSAWFLAERGPVAVTPKAGQIEILDQANGKTLGRIDAHARSVSEAAGTADGRHLVTTDGQEVKVWDLGVVCGEKGEPTGTHEAFYVHVTPDGIHAVLVKCPSVQVLRLDESGTAVLSFTDGDRQDAQPGGNGPCVRWEEKGLPDYSRVSMSPDGAWVLCNSPDGTLRRYATNGSSRASGQLKSSCRQKVLAWSPDSAFVVFGTEDGLAVSVWKADPGPGILGGTHPLVMKFPRKIHDLAFSPDGRLLVTAHEDGVRVLDLVQRKLAATFPGWADRVAVGDDGFVLVGHQHRVVGVWNLASGQREAEGRAEGYYGAALSPDGRWAVTETGMGRLTVERRISGQANLDKAGEIDGSVQDFFFDLSALGVVFTSDGEHALTTLKQDGLALWHLPSCRRIARIRGFRPFARLAVSRDCRTIVATDTSLRVHIFRLQGSLMPVEKSGKSPASEEAKTR